MYTRMKFIVGVALLVIQLTSIRALDSDHASEHSQIPTLTSASRLANEDSAITEDFGIKNKFIPRMGNANPRGRRVDNIIFDMESRNFDKAVERIGKIKKDLQGAMNNVVHNVYKNSESNMELILQLVNRNQNISSNLAILHALNIEMINNHHDSYLGRLKVMKAFNDKVPEHPDQSSLLTEDEASQAETLKMELKNLAVKSTADLLKDAMKSNNSQALSTISENVYNNCPVLYLDAIKQALQEGYDEISKPYLLDFFLNHKYDTQRIYFYSALHGIFLKRMKTKGLPLYVHLALDFKRLWDQGITDAHARDIGSSMRFPESVQNLASGLKLCIESAHYHTRYSSKSFEKLYASSQTYGADRRIIYNWRNDENVLQGYWFVVQHEGAFHIINKFYDKQAGKFREEHLYASDSKNSENEREVYTRAADSPDGEEFDWIFVTNGHNVFIKNVKYQEFLYGSHDGFDGDDRRKVYTKKAAEGASIWSVKDCHAKPWGSPYPPKIERPDYKPKPKNQG